MTDTIMLEAPARGGRISDLADGQGRILRLHDIIPRPHLPCQPGPQAHQRGQPNRKPNAYRRESHDRTEAR